MTGPGINRYRPVGLDFDGTAYVPVYVDWADRTHMVVGHPIAADESGREVFIQVTHISDNPDQWHIAVNNPTDRRIKTRLRQAMDLPGLQFAEESVELQPGEHRVLR